MKIIKYTFEALFVYSLFLIVRILGLKIGRKLIASLFLNIGFVFKSKEIVKKNISYALGQLNENEIKNITEFMDCKTSILISYFFFVCSEVKQSHQNYQNGYENVCRRIIRRNRAISHMVNRHYYQNCLD